MQSLNTIGCDQDL